MSFASYDLMSDSFPRENHQTTNPQELWTPFWRLMTQGHPNAVKLFLATDSRMWPHARSLLGESLLHLAADQGHVELLGPLIDAGLDVNDTDHLNQTPLHSAAVNQHVPVMQWLLQHGADIQRQTSTGLTVWRVYLDYWQRAYYRTFNSMQPDDIAKAFDWLEPYLGHRTDDDPHPFFLAAQSILEYGHPRLGSTMGTQKASLIRTLARRQRQAATVQAQQELSETLKHARWQMERADAPLTAPHKSSLRHAIPLLHMAVLRRESESLKALLDIGVDVAERNSETLATVLHIVAHHPHPMDGLDRLLSHPSLDWQARDQFGHTCLETLFERTSSLTSHHQGLFDSETVIHFAKLCFLHGLHLAPPLSQWPPELQTAHAFATRPDLLNQAWASVASQDHQDMFKEPARQRDRF
jgi:ankyrin repeat protein